MQACLVTVSMIYERLGVYMVSDIVLLGLRKQHGEARVFLFMVY